MSIDRLHNWGRYCRASWHPQSCGSAEKFYRPPPVETADEDKRRAPRHPVDSLDAQRVESAWRRLPMVLRLTLKWIYVYPVHPRIAERKAQIPRGSYESSRQRAECEIFLILSRKT